MRSIILVFLLLFQSRFIDQFELPISPESVSTEEAAEQMEDFHIVFPLISYKHNLDLLPLMNLSMVDLIRVEEKSQKRFFDHFQNKSRVREKINRLRMEGGIGRHPKGEDQLPFQYKADVLGSSIGYVLNETEEHQVAGYTPKIHR